MRKHNTKDRRGGFLYSLALPAFASCSRKAVFFSRPQHEVELISIYDFHVRLWWTYPYPSTSSRSPRGRFSICLQLGGWITCSPPPPPENLRTSAQRPDPDARTQQACKLTSSRPRFFFAFWKTGHAVWLWGA